MEKDLKSFRNHHADGPSVVISTVPWLANETPVWTMFFLFLLLSSLLIFNHRENIQRLLKGQEGQLSPNKKE